MRYQVFAKIAGEKRSVPVGKPRSLRAASVAMCQCLRYGITRTYKNGTQHKYPGNIVELAYIKLCQENAK